MNLSYESLLNLGLMANGFSGGNSPNKHHQHESGRTPPINATSSLIDGCAALPTLHGPACSCPQRQTPPPRPSELPFPCTPENNARMKAWHLERYGSSTFNTCPHHPLPCMDGPPIEMHVEDTATPKAYHTPASIPVHWQQGVYNDLLRDEALGVIARVPYREPVTWCHRMVITRKHDGSPRRTIDLSPLNKFCKRETFSTKSPFQLARRIPKNTWMHGMDTTAYPCVNQTDPSRHSSHRLGAGTTPGHPKASYLREMDTIADLTLCFPHLNAKNAVWTTPPRHRPGAALVENN